MHLTPTEALQKRDQLVNDGYTVIQNVVDEPMLDELRAWTEEYFTTHDVDPKYRYQGSDIQVVPPSRWDERPRELSERVFPPPYRRALPGLSGLKRPRVRAIQLEDLTPSGGIIILSKPPQGPPLYWHQDFMNWGKPGSSHAVANQGLSLGVSDRHDAGERLPAGDPGHAHQADRAARHAAERPRGRHPGR